MSDIVPLRALIVDDEPLARRGLEIRLARVGGVEIKETCANGREALAAVAAHKPDMIFLDIRMPGMDGFDLLEALARRGIGELPLIVFVTAYDAYAVRAFKEHAFEYLLKPPDDERLAQVIERARTTLRDRRQVRQSQRLLNVIAELRHARSDQFQEALLSTLANMEQGFAQEIVVRDRGRTVFVPVDDIDWVAAERDYVRIWAGGRSHLVRETMKQMEEQLNPAIFVRVHRSAIVNLRRVSELRASATGSPVVVIKSGERIRVGRSYRRRLAAQLGPHTA